MLHAANGRVEYKLLNLGGNIDPVPLFAESHRVSNFGMCLTCVREPWGCSAGVPSSQLPLQMFASYVLEGELFTVQGSRGLPREEHPVPAELVEVDGEGPHAALRGAWVVLLAAHPVGCPLGAAPPGGVPDVELHVGRLLRVRGADVQLGLVGGQRVNPHHQSQVLVGVVQPDPVITTRFKLCGLCICLKFDIR